MSLLLSVEIHDVITGIQIVNKMKDGKVKGSSLLHYDNEFERQRAIKRALDMTLNYLEYERYRLDY